MFKRTLVILSSTALFGTSSNIFSHNTIFLFKVAGYKKPRFKVFAHKAFLFKTGFEQMMLKYGICFIRLH